MLTDEGCSVVLTDGGLGSASIQIGTLEGTSKLCKIDANTLKHQFKLCTFN